ncbi:MAG: hypothetical protein SF053_18230 [Bacteroidia bacterium]|nr:hypothetical protein [Bacteroidia bacterium]
MNRNTCLLVLLLECLLLYAPKQAEAQSPDPYAARLTWGPPIFRREGSTRHQLLGQSSHGLYALRKAAPGVFQPGEQSRYWLERYDQAKNLAISQPLLSGQAGCTFQTALVTPEQVWVLYTAPGTMPGECQLMAEALVPETLKPQAPPIILGHIPDGCSPAQAETFQVVHTPDSSKILVHGLIPGHSSQDASLVLMVFDSQFSVLLWAQAVEQPADFEPVACRVSHDGSVYVAGRYSGTHTGYEIQAFSELGRQYQRYPLDLADRRLTDLTITLMPGGDLICAGLYTYPHTRTAGGILRYQLGPSTGWEPMMTQADFGPALISTLPVAARISQPLHLYRLQKVAIRSDGGLLVLAEQHQTEEVPVVARTGKPATHATFYYYHYHDILALSLAPDGAIEWATVIPKRQTTSHQHDPHISFASYIGPDHIGFVFNDHPDNLPDPHRRNVRPYNGHKSAAVLIRLDMQGDFVQHQLFNNEDHRILMRPGGCFQLSAQEMILYGERGRNARLGSMKLID